MNPVAYTTPEELQYLELEKTAFIYKELFRETAIPLYTLAQVKVMVAQEREACAKVAEAYEPRCGVCPGGVADAIRARGE